MKMVSHIQQIQTTGFALSRKHVQILASKPAQKLGIKYRFCVAKGRAGRDWFVLFMRRCPETSVRMAEGCVNGADGRDSHIL
jgi:hypothetical protein